MSIPQDRKYLPSHEWHLVEGSIVTIGITKVAADQLSDITYVELPKVGTMLQAGSAFGEIESVKATSELFSGVSGKVVTINTELNNHPEWVNQQPFSQGWMIKVEATSPAELEKLWNAAQYAQVYPT
ncbi:MAG: Glycine cleavage system H protein [Phycisphaerae bacterium]|nr:Glycine cleavage system H protein [Phycisphaerae bacterium]